MDNDRRFEIQNRLIGTDQILEISNYLQKTCNYYLDLIQKDKEKNNNAYISDGQYQYYNYLKPEVTYKIKYKDGRQIETTDEALFRESLEEPQYLDDLMLKLYVSYKSNIGGEKKDYDMSIYMTFQERYIYLSFSDKNMNEEAYNVSSYIRELLERGEARYSGVVKNKMAIKIVIGLAVGSILTLIGFFLLLILKNNGNEAIAMFFANPLILPILGWIIAFTFGTILAGPITDNLYKEIDGASESVYRDKTKYAEEYKKRNEVLIGANCNNLAKRETIKKIYDIAKKVVFIRLAISILIIILLAVFKI